MTSILDDHELRLVAACLRPLAAAGRVTAIHRAAAGGFDPARLAALARRHRVAGLVEQGLAAAGVPLPAELAVAAQRARLQALRLAGEEVRIGRALAAAGIDALFVKGATLAMLAHGRLGLKASWDVDVLVARDRAAAAGEVLAGLGYRLTILGGAVTDPVHVRRYLAAQKEAEWCHSERGTVVELHTALADNPAAIRSIGLGSPREVVAPVPGEPLATLAPAPLFAYLAYHGASHLWARLKWLADIAALVHGADIAALHAEAVALGAGRTPGVAIALAHELLGIDVPPPLLAATRADRAARSLLRRSHAAIVRPRDDLLRRSLPQVIAFVAAQASLMPGLPHRWGTVRRFLGQPYLPAHLRLPRWAVPLGILAIMPMRRLARAWRDRQVGGKTASRP